MDYDWMTEIERLFSLSVVVIEYHIDCDWTTEIEKLFSLSMVVICIP